MSQESLQEEQSNQYERLLNDRNTDAIAEFGNRARPLRLKLRRTGRETGNEVRVQQAINETDMLVGVDVNFGTEGQKELVTRLQGQDKKAEK